MKVTGIYCLLIAILVVPGFTAAEVYRWTDEYGRVHYGDKPTSGSSEINVKNKSGAGKAADKPARPVSRLEAQQRYLRARELERADKKQARAEAKQLKAERKRNCEQAKKDQKKYKYASGLYDKGKDGERHYLSFKERDAYQKKLDAGVKKWCGRS